MFSDDPRSRSHPYILNPEDTDSRRIKQEREKAKALRKTNWWIQLLNQGICHYCEKTFKPADLTMDHVVPLARGGRSVKGNLVPACRQCNQNKKLDTPADQLLKQIK